MQLSLAHNIVTAIRAQQPDTEFQGRHHLSSAQFILVCRQLGLLAARAGVGCVAVSVVRACYDAVVALHIRQLAFQKSALNASGMRGPIPDELALNWSELSATLLAVIASTDMSAHPSLLRRFLPGNLNSTAVDTKEQKFLNDYLLVRITPR
jgi:hypothetical protein